MRYSVGEKVVIMFYVIEDRRPFSNSLFIPWKDRLKEIWLKTLTVTEHHKVAWDQDPSGKKEYDGFILVDDQGHAWSNQYPCASYGQITTQTDYYFDKWYPADTDVSTLSDTDVATYEDVTVTIDRIKRGVEELKAIDTDKSHQLAVHLDWLIKKVQRETGAMIVFRPIWEDTPSIVRCHLTWPEVK